MHSLTSGQMAFWASGRSSHPAQSFTPESPDSLAPIPALTSCVARANGAFQLILRHIGLRQNLVARLLVNLGFCRIRFWYAVASGSGISRETSRIFFWNLTQVQVLLQSSKPESPKVCLTSRLSLYRGRRLSRRCPRLKRLERRTKSRPIFRQHVFHLGWHFRIYLAVNHAIFFQVT